MLRKGRVHRDRYRRDLTEVKWLNASRLDCRGDVWARGDKGRDVKRLGRRFNRAYRRRGVKQERLRRVFGLFRGDPRGAFHGRLLRLKRAA